MPKLKFTLDHKQKEKAEFKSVDEKGKAVASLTLHLDAEEHEKLVQGAVYNVSINIVKEKEEDPQL